MNPVDIESFITLVLAVLVSFCFLVFIFFSILYVVDPRPISIFKKIKGNHHD